MISTQAFEKDWVYAFDAIRPVPQHRLVSIKVKTSSGKKHRLRIAPGRAAYQSERRLGRKALGRVKIRLDPPAPKGWGLCGLDARPEAIRSRCFLPLDVLTLSETRRCCGTGRIASKA